MSVGSSQRIAKAPPHSEYTVHELKKNKEIDNPFALAWDMKNKGKKLHDKKPKKSAWKSFFQRIADAVATPNKGSDKWPPSPDKGAKDSWTNQILNEAKSIPDGEYWWMHGDRPMLLNDTDIRRTTKESVIQQYYRTGFKELPPDVQVKISAAATRQYKKRSYKEAFEGAAPPFGSPEREEWSSGKKKDEEPESTPDKDDKTTKEANQYFHCPNCGHQGDVSDFPLNEPDMGRMTQRCPQCGKSFDVDEGDMVNTDKSKGQPADSYDDFGINRNYRGANRTNSGKQAAVDFTQKPDGTINIAVEGLPDVPASPQDMGAMEAPVTGTGNGTGAAATPATPPDTGNTPPAKGGKSSNMVGRKVVDSVLGNGTVTAVRGNQVIASFADGNYTTSAANIL
jgi:transcription elongation factor Elf1